MSKEERVVCLAIAELNEQKRKEDTESAVENALIRVLNKWIESRR